MPTAKTNKTQDLCNRIAAYRALLTSPAIAAITTMEPAPDQLRLLEDATGMTFTSQPTPECPTTFQAFLATTIQQCNAVLDQMASRQGRKYLPGDAAAVAWTLRDAERALLTDDSDIHLSFFPVSAYTGEKAIDELPWSQTTLTDTLAGVRYILGDYDPTVPHEKAFLALCELTISTITHNHGRLLRRARDSITLTMAIPEARLVAGVDCSGVICTYGLHPQHGKLNLSACNSMQDVGTIYLMEGVGWKEITRADLQALAESTYVKSRKRC